MNFSKKQLILVLCYILLFSLCVNIYSLSKIITDEKEKKEGDQGDIQKYVSLIDEKNKRIEQLELLKSPTVKTNNTSNEQKQKVEQKDNRKEVSNAALRFVEYAFNTNPDTYVERKKNAHNYMSDEIIEILFPSDGQSEKKMGLRTSVNETKVYLEDDAEDEAIVYYNLTREILSIDFTEDSDNYVQLKFTTDNGVKKVSEIKAINIVGGV